MIGMQVKNKYFFTLPVFAAIALSICLASSTGAEKKPATAPATSRATTKPVEPGFEKGTFDKITVHIGRLVKLNWKGENLQLDRKNWTKDFEDKTRAEALNLFETELKQRYPNPSSKNYRAQKAERILNSPPVEGAFIRLRTAAGRLQTANAGGTINVRNSAFTTTQLKGKLEYDKAGLISVVLEEKSPPNRMIVFNDAGDGTLMIALSGNRGRLSLEIKQSKDGSFYVKHVSGKNVFTGEENSFQAFHARHRRYVEGRLFPLLRHVGIITPLTAYGSDEVKKATLARLRSRPTPEKTAQGQKLIKQLNSNLYKKRQEAGKALAADFESYRDLIVRTIREPSTPPETVSRLKMIVKAKPKQKPADEFVTAQKLTANVGYLVNLLGEVKPADRAIVAKALRQLTKQKFGPDPAKWKKWWSKKQSGKSTTKPGEPK
jgi:hypothetical protein